MPKKFIQRINIRKDALRKQLKIPKGKRIPMTLLDKIISAKAGQSIKNPTKIGVKKIKVTRLLEHRSILARNLKMIKRR
tara:strand:- start:44 stop:280 length:237 start_codon:yes stop_codon:yes gene_type:complete